MIIQGNEYTVGADPEVFVGNKGAFVSAHGMVPGDKGRPFEVEGGAVQVDGMALEFNIDPARNYEEFQSRITGVKDQLLSMIPEEFDFMENASVLFDEDFLRDIPPKNKLLGCSADYNGWTREVNPSPKQGSLMRTAGGHAHVGGFFDEVVFRPAHFNKGADLAKLMDEEIGIYSILWDKDDKRRSMYGKAGCFRPKKYGMEYRSLSNAWIFSRDITKFVFEGTQRAIQRLVEGDTKVNPDVEVVINNSDRNSYLFNNNPLAEEAMSF